MLREHSVVEQASCVLGGKVVGRDEVGHLSKTVSDGKDVLVAALGDRTLRGREFNYEVNSNLLLSSTRNRVRSQCALALEPRCRRAFADVTFA